MLNAGTVSQVIFVLEAQRKPRMYCSTGLNWSWCFIFGKWNQSNRVAVLHGRCDTPILSSLFPQSWLCPLGGFLLLRSLRSMFDTSSWFIKALLETRMRKGWHHLKQPFFNLISNHKCIAKCNRLYSLQMSYEPQKNPLFHPIIVLYGCFIGIHLRGDLIPSKKTNRYSGTTSKIAPNLIPAIILRGKYVHVMQNTCKR